MKRVRLFLVLAALISPVSAQFAPMPQTVGIPSNVMNFSTAAQRRSQWCWAASIQMVLSAHGVRISQERIVARSYGVDPQGNLPDWAGSWEVITSNLNNWDLDEMTGRPYAVACQYGQGPPPPQVLLNELARGQPIILACSMGGGGGHAVVITAVTFVPTPMGPSIQTITIRDPWPSPENAATGGRQVVPAAQFAGSMRGYWIVRVR